jgi:serine/threonine protein kinase
LFFLVLQLEHIQVLHAVDFLYRDVKPDNFVFGVGAKSKVLHIVDMGLAKCYRTPKTKKIIACREGKSLTGTPRYASLNVHRGLETSRRDDIESLAYMLIYLYVGSLPWQGTPARSKPAKYKAIYDLKCKFVPDQLCGPSFLRTMLVHALSLQYEDEPDYHFLRTMLHEAAQEHKVNLIDPVFDWDVPASLGVSYPPRTESVYLKSIQPLQMRVAALETQNAALIKETEQLRTQLKDAQNTAELLIWENRTMVTPANARRRSIKIIRQGKQVQAVRVEPQDTVLAKRKAPDVPVVSDQPSKKPKV